MNRRLLLVAGLVLGLAAACTPGAPATPSPSPVPPSPTPPATAAPQTPSPTQPSNSAPAGVQGRQFVSVAVTDGGSDRPLVPGTRIVIEFGDELSADAGCNHLFGSYRIDGDTLVVDAMGGTEMGCQPALMDQDEWLVAFLTSRPTITVDGADLTLTSGQVTIDLQDRDVAEPDQDLEGVTWTLTSIMTGDAVASVPQGIVATFLFQPDGTLALNAGCNTGGGQFTVDGNQVAFGEIMLTRMACGGAADGVERSVTELLAAESLTYSIDSNTLTLTDGTNGLIFSAAVDLPLR